MGTFRDVLAFATGSRSSPALDEEMLITAGIAKRPGDLDRVSAKFFKPVTLPEMIRLRTSTDFYLVY